MAGRGEYEPKDSRNVTGTASTEDGRWTNRDGSPPLANGGHPEPQPHEAEEDDDEEDEIVLFEPDPELQHMIDAARVRRQAEARQTRH